MPLIELNGRIEHEYELSPYYRSITECILIWYKKMKVWKTSIKNQRFPTAKNPYMEKSPHVSPQRRVEY